MKSKEQIFKLTHFLCLPIATVLSIPQLEQRLQQFRNDPTTSKIPPGAYRPLQTLHIPIRPLSLPAADRIEAASHHLQNLDIDSLLRRKSDRTPGHTTGVRQMQQRGSAHTFSTDSRLPPLTITLSGIRSTHMAGRGSMLDGGSLHNRLHASYTDPTSRVGAFRDEIKRSFDVAGFQIPRYRRFRPSDTHLITILSTKHAWSRPKINVPDHAKPGKFRRAPPPMFETKEITEKFENFVLVENVRLEKLSLCELGLWKELEKPGTEAQLSEVCSVPLL